MNLVEYYKKSEPVLGVAKILFLRLFELYEHFPISKIAKSTSGGTPNRGNAEYYNGNIPWLKSGELNDSIIKTCSEFITDEGLKNSSAKLFPKGTLLVAMYGATAGKTGILSFEASTNQAVCALFQNTKVERDYLHWFLKQHRINFILQSKGGAQPNISQKVIKETLIPVPPLDIQKKVITFLNNVQNNSVVNHNIDVLDDISLKKINQFFKIRNTQEILNRKFETQKKLISQLKQAILQEAIQGKLTEDWRKQNPDVEPASELLKRIKAEKAQLIKEKKIKKEKPLPPITEDEIPFEIPENWSWCRLGEIIVNASNLNIQKELPRNEIINYVDIDAIDNKRQIIREPKQVMVCNLSSRARRVLKKGWIMYSLVRPYLHNLAIVDENKKNYIGSTGFAVFDCIEIENKFIFQLLMSKYIENLYLDFMDGFNSPSITHDQFRTTLIPLPPLEEQKAIVEKVESLMQKVSEMEEEIQKSEQNAEMLMQAVLKEAFEGKKEVEV
jgi:type I restriction enzyme S subunit